MTKPVVWGGRQELMDRLRWNGLTHTDTGSHHGQSRTGERGYQWRKVHGHRREHERIAESEQRRNIRAISASSVWKEKGMRVTAVKSRNMLR